MWIPLLVLVVFLFLLPVLIARLRMWTQLRMYHKIQRDFFQKRVHFVPEHPTPIAPPPNALYNFIEAEHFIAVLGDPAAAVRHKTAAVETIRAAQGMIKSQQQAVLRRLLDALIADPNRPIPLGLLDEALLKLDQATLIG
jgi:hypothetical protein